MYDTDKREIKSVCTILIYLSCPRSHDRLKTLRKANTAKMLGATKQLKQMIYLLEKHEKKHEKGEKSEPVKNRKNNRINRKYIYIEIA